AIETTIEQQVAMDEALVPSAQRNILHICPRVQGKSFAELPFEEEILDFIRFLRHSATIRTLTDVNINKLYQPWRSFAAIINKNVNYAFLKWEDFVFQVKHKNQKKCNEMYYPRFTKVIIHHFMLKALSIPRRNKVNWHYVRDDFMFSTIKLVSKHQNTQQFGALLPIELTNEEIRNSKAYKEYYAIATREAAPKPKASARRTRIGSDTSITPPTAATTPRMTAAAKGKQTAKASKSKRIPDVPTDESKEEISWNSSDDEGADDKGKDDNDENNDGDKGDADDKEQEVTKNDDKDDTEESDDDDKEGSSDEEDDDEETKDEESFDLILQTPKRSKDEGDGEEDPGLNTGTLEVKDTHVTLTPVKPDGQQENSSVSSQFVINMLNSTLDIGMESIFEATSQLDVPTPTFVAPLPITTPTMTPSTIATTTTTTSQAPILPTTIPSDITQNLPNFTLVFCFDDRLRSLEQKFSEAMQTNQFAGAVSAIPGIVQHYMDQQINEAVQVAVQLQSDRLREKVQRENDDFFRTVDENIKKIIKEQLKFLPDHHTHQEPPVAANLSEMELKKIIIEKMEGNKSIQRSDAQRNLYKALFDAYKSDKIILDTYGEVVTLKRRRDDDEDKDEEPSARPDQGSKRRKEGKEPESASTPSKTATKSVGRSTTGYRSRQASTSESSFAEEPVQTTFQMEKPSHLEFETGVDDQPIVQSSQHPEWFSQPQKPPSPDHDWNKTLPAVHGSIQPWISELAKQADTHSFFNELMDTPLDFSNFIMNRLRVDTLTSELLAGPTYDLMKGSCKSLTDQLDWVNPEGQQGASSRKYTTSVTKTKAADYGHIKWIEDLVPRTMWIQEPIDYDKHALWGVSHWGRKRQQFYGFAVNQESAHDVYSKRTIIAVTKLKIVEWHSYKHLDWIMVRRDDDKLYKFKEGDLKRLRIQDIEDMLLLLVQGKQTNLTVEERFAFNVSLRMFTRSIVIQRRVEDLQLGVESYQKRLNLMKPDTYRSELKRKEAYTAYSHQRGFIYQNKDKKNRLMRIVKLHKFCDGTFTDVRTALDDRLKGIQMQYLPQTIWRESDKDRAVAMIQATDKKLKTRRIMRSLERFIGGRLYGGDFRMLQRTI
nr:hypothetical protein [Tanacetum cinerariifolium]